MAAAGGRWHGVGVIAVYLPYCRFVWEHIGRSHPRPHPAPPCPVPQCLWRAGYGFTDPGHSLLHEEPYRHVLFDNMDGRWFLKVGGVGLGWEWVWILGKWVEKWMGERARNWEGLVRARGDCCVRAAA